MQEEGERQWEWRQEQRSGRCRPELPGCGADGGDQQQQPAARQSDNCQL